MFAAPWITLMLIVPLVSSEEPQMRWNDPATAVHAAKVADHDDHRNSPLVGANLPLCSSHGEPLSMLDMVVLSLPSIRAQNAAMLVSRRLPSRHDEEKQAPRSNSPD
jgi:hypothetical protein